MTETLSHPAESAEFLSRLHDGELSAGEAAAFEAHRRECPECRASVAEFEGALAAYRSAPVSPHASDLSARILRKIRATSPSRRPFGVMFGIDVRWAGALVAALLVVIIGAPVFSRREATPAAIPPRPASPAPIPAYVLDAEEERPAEKRAEAAPPARPNAAPKSEAKDAAAAPEPPAARDNLFAADPSNAAGDAAGTRTDQLAATNADKRDRVAALEGSVAQETAVATSLQATPPAETKELSRSVTARRQSAAAPVGGEAGAGAAADDAPARRPAHDPRPSTAEASRPRSFRLPRTSSWPRCGAGSTFSSSRPAAGSSPSRSVPPVESSRRTKRGRWTNRGSRG